MVKDDELFNQAYRAYHEAVRHGEQRDIKSFQMNSYTYERFKTIARSTGKNALGADDWLWCAEGDEKCMAQKNLPATLFGTPVKLNEALPDDIVKPEIETPAERRIKEIAESWSRDPAHRGMSLNIMVPTPIEWVHIPTPQPTLKALVKKWKRDARKWLKAHGVK